MKTRKGLQMKKITSLAVASIIAMASYAPAANAWGPREQGIVTGVAGLWVYQQLSKPPVTVYQQPPVIVQQPPQVIYQQQPPVVYQQQRQVCRTDYIIVDNIQRTAQTCWFE
jgi:hypothetical protein